MVDDHSVRMHIQKRIQTSTKSEFETLAELGLPFQYVNATFWVEAEVNNGGFDQYFYNTGGLWVPHATAGFRAMGADSYADLLEEANRVFLENYPKPKSENQDVEPPWYQKNHRRIPAFEALDKRFYSLEEQKRPAAYREEYIQENLEVFKKVPPVRQ